MRFRVEDVAPDADLSDDRPELLPSGSQVVLAALAVRPREQLSLQCLHLVADLAGDRVQSRFRLRAVDGAWSVACVLAAVLVIGGDRALGR